MSRVAKQPVNLPQGVEVTILNSEVSVKGPKGLLKRELGNKVRINNQDNQVTVEAADASVSAKAMSGTARALINNMVAGVSDGFEKKLTLVGVGYRAQAQGTKLNLSLGFSHPVEYDAPEGISFEVNKQQNEITITGIDKQAVGQVAANIRRIRPPEPYKGKGVRYSDERVIMKEAKKK